MKVFLNYQNVFIIFLIFLGISIRAYPQAGKYKARVSLMYTHIMDKESYIAISAKYKGENGFAQAADLEFSVYQMDESTDSLAYLGKVKTNSDGKAKFNVPADLPKNSNDAFNYIVRIENDKRFEDGEASVSFSYASLSAEITKIDSVNTISAILTDGAGNPVQGELLKVGLKRLYGSLQIGEDSYETDADGAILVPIEKPMPGVDGNLTYEVVLSESDTYGTIKAEVNAPIGIPIVDQSTFDERTMWSPPTKTPLYLLIFPNLIILSVWIPLLILTINLYRISKSKT